MTRILITGAAGLVGQALLPELQGHEVFATDLKQPKSMPENVHYLPMDVTTDAPRTCDLQREAGCHSASGLHRDASAKNGTCGGICG